MATPVVANQEATTSNMLPTNIVQSAMPAATYGGQYIAPYHFGIGNGPSYATHGYMPEYFPKLNDFIPKFHGEPKKL